ncbi:unnamed protein product [Hermetia illucens]|uniref:Apolipoprotein D n=1 Tax=Hermetia illucens TaxID=343691 RepID=A0A7R8V6I5_HERIL|nr:lazarillo protein-like [Hermetia illucens]CAD7093815.1 unnamed protein product [Hermetia illucens]
MMCKVICCVLAIAIASGLVTAQVEFRKPCPDMPAVQNFKINEFGGRWFELARYDHPLVAGGECVTMDFRVDNQTVTMESTLRRKDNGNLKAPETFNIVGEFKKPYVGSFNLSHPALDSKAEHHIISTDYKNYALIWRCDQINNTFSRENAWLLARTRQLTGTINQTIEGYISAVLSPNDLHRTLQNETICQSAGNIVKVFSTFIPILIALLQSFKF